MAVGRTPNTGKLGLETVGLKPGNWLQVDDTCLVQGVEGDWLYPLGGINQRALLTHIGNYQARASAYTIIASAQPRPRIWPSQSLTLIVLIGVC